jgi:hypothetical protein
MAPSHPGPTYSDRAPLVARAIGTVCSSSNTVRSSRSGESRTSTRLVGPPNVTLSKRGGSQRWISPPALPSSLSPAHLAPDGVDLVRDIDHGSSFLSVDSSSACEPLASPDQARRSRLPRASSVSRASRGRSHRWRKRLSHSSTSCNAAEPTVYRRRVPSARTYAKPPSRRTRRCCDTAGWEIPNSLLMTAVIAPDACSPSASISNIRRRTGSPRTSNACMGSIITA